MSEKAQTIPMSWVRRESEIGGFRAEVESEGGRVHEDPEPFQPPAEELDDYRDANFEPLMVLVTTISVGFLLKTISNIWLEHKHTGGLIVDARGGGLAERPAPYLARNTLVLLTDSGVQKYDPDDRNDALEALRQLVGKK